MEIARDLTDQGMTVLAILHDLNLAALYADRVILMVDGAPQASGSPEEVIAPDRIEAAFGLETFIDAIPDDDRVFVLPRARSTAHSSSFRGG